jgi:hypothetical protein
VLLGPRAVNVKMSAMCWVLDVFRV